MLEHGGGRDAAAFLLCAGAEGLFMVATDGFGRDAV